MAMGQGRGPRGRDAEPAADVVNEDVAVDREAATPDVSIVVPVYNEEDSLPVLLERLEALRAELGEATVEVVFVDDHSTDGSPGVLRRACAARPHFHCLRLSANRGSHVAVYAGLEHCTGRCAVFLAADLQDPPELIPAMLSAWRGGAAVVWDVRTEREGVSWAERFFARVFYRLFNAMSQGELPPEGSDFVLMDRAVVDALKQSVVASPFLMGEIARLGFRPAEVPYTKQARRFGMTKWTLSRKLRLFADAFVANSYVPLRAMSYFGMLCSLLGFAYVLLIFTLRLIWGTPLQGWSSLMVAILFLGAIP